MSAIDAGFGSVALVGPFQPAAIASLLPVEAANQLAGLVNFAGVPVNLLTKALVEHGVETTLVGGIRGAESRFIAGDPLSVAVYRSSGGWPFVLNARRRERLEILSRLRQVAPSVVHAMWTLEGGRAAADWDGPKVLTVQDTAWEYFKLGWRLRPISLVYGARWLQNTSATIHRFKHIIAISPYVETYLRLIPKFRGEIRVIPNIIPELPSELKVPEAFPKTDCVTFACYGEPGPLKNIQTAIDAFHLVSEKLPESRLLVFGGGWDKYQQELTRTGKIEFRGGIPHRQFIQSLVEEVDIWVHPSKIETQGIAYCEALQAGCAVVAGRRSGAVAWALDYGRCGLLVDVEDKNELAEAMLILVRDRPAALEMVEYGQQFIRRNFSAEGLVQLHLRYYREIAG